MGKNKLIAVAVIVLAAVLAITLGVSLLSEQDRQPEPEQVQLPEGDILVCLDAGHGGDDSGAAYFDRLEKDDNLEMTLAVAEILQEQDIEVLLTREDDTDVELEHRAQIANDANATLFVSFHRNAGGGTGFEIWIDSDPDSLEIDLSEQILDNLKDVGITKDRGVKKGTAGNSNSNYLVVGQTEMPACLLELGFMDSEQDNEAFVDNFDGYAQAIASAIMSFLDENKQ